MTSRTFSQVLQQYYPVRNLPAQKEAFLFFAASRFSKQAPAFLDRHGLFGFGCTNMVFGDPAHADVIAAAYYDTPKRRFFPYRRHYDNPLAQCLQTLLPLGLLAAMCLFAVRLLQWPIFSALLLFFPLAIAASCAFYNAHNANYSSGLISLHAFCERYSGNLCIVLLDRRRALFSGKWFFQRKYRKALGQTPFVLFDLTGFGEILFLRATKPFWPTGSSLPVALRKKRGKRSFLQISMAQKSPLGHVSGPICTPADDTILPAAWQQAADAAEYLLRHTSASR